MSLEAPDSTTHHQVPPGVSEISKNGGPGGLGDEQTNRNLLIDGSAETVITCQGRIMISDLAIWTTPCASEVDSVYTKTLKDQNTSMYIYICIYIYMTPEREKKTSTPWQLNAMDTQLSILSGASLQQQRRLVQYQSAASGSLSLSCSTARAFPRSTKRLTAQGQVIHETMSPDEGCQDHDEPRPLPFWKKGTLFPETKLPSSHT